MIVCVARLRENVKYTGPLTHILDSFYELLRSYIAAHRSIEWRYYGISFDGSKPVRNPEDVKSADVVIIPTEHEFHYHIPGYFHPKYTERSNERVEGLRRFVKNKRIVLLRSDRADDPELFREYTFRVPSDYRVVDELDFRYGVHAMKYHFIRNRNRSLLFGENRNLDFAYWGSCKNKIAGGENSKDVRHAVLRELKKDSRISGLYVGRYVGFKADMPMMPLGTLLATLSQARATLCFNWIDPSAITSRYHEAMAFGLVPFVWREYDKRKELAKFEWQRVHSVSEAREKILGLRKHYEERFQELCGVYNPPQPDYYRARFFKILNSSIS